MSGEGTGSPTLMKLLSAPGLVALAFLGITALAASRFVGADTFVREVVTEVVAGFGNAIIVLAVFGLFFRTGLDQLLRRTPGGDTLAQSAEQLRELLGAFDQRSQELERAQYGEKLDRLVATVESLANESIPALRGEVEALRRQIPDAEQGRETS